MLSIGDVFSVVAILFGTALSAWALLIGSTMVFSHKAKIAESLIRHAPGRTFVLGLVTLLIAGIISLGFLAMPNPLFKLFGWSGALIVLSLASLGTGGLVLLVASRLHAYDSELRPFAALSRSAMYIVLAGVVPLVGLFIIVPAVLAIGLGAGVQALFMREALWRDAGELVA